MTTVPAGTEPAEDQLAELFDEVVDGRYPPDDGGFSVLPPDQTTGQHAVLCFTGHAVVASDLPLTEIAALGIDGYGQAHHPDVLRGLAGPGGWIGVLDAVLVAKGTGVGDTALTFTDIHHGHHRVAYARETRTEVRVLADERGLVTLGVGLGGRTELGIELVGASPGGGHGRSLLRDVLAEFPAGKPVWASCAPGNARSLRALIGVGFVPVGSEVLLQPAG